MQPPQSSPLPGTLTPLHDEFPPLQIPVIVTMDDGAEFRAMRIYVEDGEDGAHAWATAEEYEPAAPECWDDGVCWASNADGKPSRQPVAWRNI